MDLVLEKHASVMYWRSLWLKDADIFVDGHGKWRRAVDSERCASGYLVGRRIGCENSDARISRNIKYQSVVAEFIFIGNEFHFQLCRVLNRLVIVKLLKNTSWKYIKTLWTFYHQKKSVVNSAHFWRISRPICTCDVSNQQLRSTTLR